jgi:hypothetical protein
MVKRQSEGAAMSDPLLLEAGIELFAEACPEQPSSTWCRPAVETRNCARLLSIVFLFLTASS